ncbi:hypothetical protein AJ78_05142 [Emergomyces pasteurianus Ep9510]|uniref:Uncharacterized protein n=1 Tax=Emergomyces pasteurianus Ep9510 TaxID=1447872 RepID=A0A1J9PD72_9EURO|nr:hypothetical protein AJ78_05142 [Emergomyces pasteurianus Ep9510]
MVPSLDHGLLNSSQYRTSFAAMVQKNAERSRPELSGVGYLQTWAKLDRSNQLLVARWNKTGVLVTCTNCHENPHRREPSPRPMLEVAQPSGLRAPSHSCVLD